MKRNPDLRVPFSAVGLRHHVARWEENDVDWRDNDEFDATLKIVGIIRGRSAAYFTWEDVKTKQQYPMFMSDAQHTMELGLPAAGGVVRGGWYVVKRGQNYGVRPSGRRTRGSVPGRDGISGGLRG